MTEKVPVEENNDPVGDKSKEPSVPEKGIEDSSLDKLNVDIDEPEKTATNMEANHHHGNHNGRKVKDYIFEFIMVFVAITGGFFMENMREYFADRHKEKEYINSLIKDIEVDTTSIQLILKHDLTQVKGIDSLINVLENPVTNIDLDKWRKYNFQYLLNYQNFIIHDISITQLKNSGGFRLIDNQSVADRILNYYSTFDNYRDQENYNFRYVQDLINLETEFLYFHASKNGYFDLELYDSGKIKNFNSRVVLFQELINGDLYWLKAYYKQGSSLLSYLKKEYKINN